MKAKNFMIKMIDNDRDKKNKINHTKMKIWLIEFGIIHFNMNSTYFLQ